MLFESLSYVDCVASLLGEDTVILYNTLRDGSSMMEKLS